jgi:polyisoprenoid-binding protein YceI
MIRALLCGGRVLALLAAAQLASAAGAIDPAKSSVSVTFTQLGVPVQAHFRKFNADIAFDPAAPAAASARVSVDIASFDLGDPEYNSELGKKEWFDTSRFPQATFVADSIKVVSAGKLEATGKLAIKGKSETVTVPVSVEQQGAAQVFTGSLSIQRRHFDIGEGEWRDTDVLADPVLIKFKMVKTAAP